MNALFLLRLAAAGLAVLGFTNCRTPPAFYTQSAVVGLSDVYLEGQPIALSVQLCSANTTPPRLRGHFVARLQNNRRLPKSLQFEQVQLVRGGFGGELTTFHAVEPGVKARRSASEWIIDVDVPIERTAPAYAAAIAFSGAGDRKYLVMVPNVPVETCAGVSR